MPVGQAAAFVQERGIKSKQIEKIKRIAGEHIVEYRRRQKVR
jgi:hypothetical protein